MAPGVNSKVANNPSGAAGANSGPSAAELARDVARYDVGPQVDNKPTRSEMAKAEQARSEQADKQLRRDLDNLAQLAQGAREVISGKRTDAEQRQAHLDSARQAAAQADRARGDAKPVEPKQQPQSAKDVPPANKPTNAELARNSKNPNQQQSGQDPQNRNTSAFLGTSVPHGKAAAATLAHMSKGKVAEQKLPESLVAKLAAKADKAPGNQATPAHTAAAPAKPGEQKPTDAQAAQALTKDAARLGKGAERKESTREKKAADRDSDDVADSGSASPTASNAAVASDQRVERKGDGQGDSDGQGRDAEQLAALAELAGSARSVRTLPTVERFGVSGDPLVVNREQSALDAKAGLWAVMQPAWSSVMPDLDSVQMARGGLGARIMSGHADLALLLQMQLTTANARVG